MERVARDPIYKGRRFSAETIETCVRWYITYLSYRDLVAMMAEQGISRVPHDHHEIGAALRLSMNGAGRGTPDRQDRLAHGRKRLWRFAVAGTTCIARWNGTESR
ncbi:MAG: hypothetical protein IPM70_07665 [Proteobacteria bacterium]|nr:hypothetical protein [Pseudomonadota bacterium]